MTSTTDPAAQEGLDNGADNQRPDWLPDNFDSPEALAKSYVEAQRKITELGNEKRGLEEAFGELSAQVEELTAATQQRQQPQPQYDYSADPYVAAISQAQMEGDYVRAQQLQDQRTAYIVQAAVQQGLQAQQPATQPQGIDSEVVAFIADQNLARQYADWEDVKSEVAQTIQDDPLFNNDAIWSNPQLATSALERAYQMVKGSKYLSGELKTGVDTTAMKIAAQTASGATGRPEPSGPDRWAEIKNATTGKLDFS
jgi:hypothetical protein